MTSASETLTKGKLIPNWSVTDDQGNKHTLWDFRQKSHLALIYDPESDAKTRERWQTAIQADQKQWNWLNVTFLIVKTAPKGLGPGVHAVNRYGQFLNTYPAGKWNFDDLEREFLYHEAYHC